MKKLAAVIGGTGQTGKHIVQKLLGQHIPVRVLSRNPAKAKKMFGNLVEIVEGDLIEVKDLKELVSGVSHLFTAHGPDDFSDKSYELVDFGATKKALKSIPAGQHTHIIHMSSIYVARSNPPFFPGRALYWKREAEKLTQRSGHPYTIVRPCWLTNGSGGRLRIKAEQGDQDDGKITREDVAEVMVQAMHFKTAIGKVFEVYNETGDPVSDWNKFFFELQPDKVIR